MVQPLDTVREARETAVKAMQQASSSAAEALDDGVHKASHAARSSALFLKENSERAFDEGQTIMDTGVSHAQQAQDQVLRKLKDGVHWVVDNQEVSAASAVLAAALILPAVRQPTIEVTAHVDSWPRHFLWRRTLGRFQSEEALFKSAERKYQGVVETLDLQIKEAAKLGQRVLLAEEQYDMGLKKLCAASKQLATLERQVASTERAAWQLARDLRELPSKEALTLRAQVAGQAASAKQQWQGLERTLYSLAKKGVY